MSFIYVLLFTCLLYIFFRPIVDGILGTNPSTQFLRIRIKIFFDTFVAPILFGLGIFFLVIQTDDMFRTIISGVVVLIGILIRIFSKNRKYLTSFQIADLRLNITYLTHFLGTGTDSFSLADISDIEIAKANWVIDYPASVSIKHKNNWVTFELIDKQLRTDIQNHIKIIAPTDTGKT